MSETATERLRNNAVKITSLLITGLWMGGLFLTDQNWWLGVLIVGYAAVLPIVKTLFGDDEEEYDDADEDGEWSHWWGREKKSGSSTDSDDEDDPLETLRGRYARGELTDEQFERKLERLLETETIEDVEDRRRAERELNYER
ncbi:SHOCT domain-containing protein [Natronoarchaeum rubrum]|uniref:SHOCT domain-containing protein n=1 Tax=Natronoarchaeum rubrum TaxID=755311 RepID=UPI002112701A|nr:SHOCT domain-containing protein [Natronoarchaeum rubrum]